MSRLELVGGLGFGVPTGTAMAMLNDTFLANRSLVLIDFSSRLLDFRDVDSGGHVAS